MDIICCYCDFLWFPVSIHSIYDLDPNNDIHACAYSIAIRGAETLSQVNEALFCAEGVSLVPAWVSLSERWGGGEGSDSILALAAVINPLLRVDLLTEPRAAIPLTLSYTRLRASPRPSRPPGHPT